VYNKTPPAGKSKDEWAEEHAQAIAEWKDAHLCPHDYTPCPLDVVGCTLEDDQMALKIHRVKVRARVCVCPLCSHRVCGLWVVW
jgi:hypothetical protein